MAKAVFKERAYFGRAVGLPQKLRYPGDIINVPKDFELPKFMAPVTSETGAAEADEAKKRKTDAEPKPHHVSPVAMGKEPSPKVLAKKEEPASPAPKKT